MTSRHVFKLIHVEDYVAEVDVELICADDDWSPYLSVADALKLDNAREALQRGDIEAAARLGKVYKLLPIAA
jgi:hypothetical protein